MKRKLLSILLACILALGMGMPVLADDPPDKLKIGDKVVLDSGHEATYLGKGEGGRGEVWQVDVGDLKYIPGTTIPIECRWDYDADKGEWYALPNLFTSIVKEGKVTVWNEGVKLSWQPDVFVGTKKLASDKNPTLLLYDPINHNYIGNTLRWQYAEGILRYLRIIEGMLIEYYTIDTMPGADILIIPHTVKDLEFVWTRPSVAWDADHQLVPLTIGKNGELTLTTEAIANATLPITIDPDTTFTTSSSDGFIQYGDATFATAHDAASGDSKSASGTTCIVGMSLDIGIYLVRRPFVYFDTSALPDEVSVTAATLRLYGSVDSSDDDFDIQVQIGSGTPPTYPHDPMVLADFNKTLYSGNGGTLTTVGFSTNAYNDLTLTADGRDWISKTGWTKFALKSDEDIANSTPTGYEEVQFYSYEKGTGYRPKLVVTYATTAPAITTDAATYVTKNTARLNSTVDDDGYEACDVRFGYGTTTQTAANFELYDTKTAWVNDTYTTGQHPYVNIASLVANTGYFYRAQIRNDDSTVTSATQIQFTTESAVSAPTNFKAYPKSTEVGLTWTLGSGAAQTMIRYSEVTYPTDETEGTLAYTGTLGSYTITGLIVGHTYYIVAIGIADGEYTAPTEVLATTLAAEAAPGELPVTGTPEGLYIEPDTTRMSNMPGYDIWLKLSTDMNIPIASIWFGVVMAITGVIAYAVFRLSNNIMAILIVLVVGLAYGTIAKQIPFWVPVIILILGLGLSQMQARRTQ